MKINSSKLGQIKGKMNLNKNCKGVSLMIGYILLVVFAIVIASIVFIWLRSYVPSEALQCPDGVSVFIKSATFDETTRELNLSLRNNGRFNIAGYFVYISNDSGQEIEVIDISQHLDSNSAGTIFANSVTFSSTGENSFKQNDESIHIFNIPEETGGPYSVRIVPTRFQEVSNKEKFVSCSNAQIKQIVNEPPEACVPDCAGKECGDDECGGRCPPDDCVASHGTEYVCEDSSGQCILTEQEEQIVYFGFESGTQGWNDPGYDSGISDSRSVVDDLGEEGGDYSWHIQDGSSSSYTQQNFDFTEYSGVRLDWYGYYIDFEDGDCIELKIDGDVVDDWGGEDCQNQVNENQWILHSIILSSTSYTFDSSVTIRFEGQMSSDYDDVYIDGINITGITL